MLANLYLHFSLDKWLEKNYADVKFVRYADDMVIHCHIQQSIQTPNEQNEFQGFVIPRPVARKVTADDRTGPF